MVCAPWGGRGPNRGRVSDTTPRWETREGQRNSDSLESTLDGGKRIEQRLGEIDVNILSY